MNPLRPNIPNILRQTDVTNTGRIYNIPRNTVDRIANNVNFRFRNTEDTTSYIGTPLTNNQTQQLLYNTMYLRE